MTEFLLSRSQSFKHAFAGWWFVISTQKNSWVHMIANHLCDHPILMVEASRARLGGIICCHWHGLDR